LTLFRSSEIEIFFPFPALILLGTVGCSSSQEYAVVGDIVNLSARLMVASYKGQHGILCDSATNAIAGEFFFSVFFFHGLETREFFLRSAGNHGGTRVWGFIKLLFWIFLKFYPNIFSSRLLYPLPPILQF
jgi:hypothetical protein